MDALRFKKLVGEFIVSILEEDGYNRRRAIATEFARDTEEEAKGCPLPDSEFIQTRRIPARAHTDGGACYTNPASPTPDATQKLASSIWAVYDETRFAFQEGTVQRVGWGRCSEQDTRAMFAIAAHVRRLIDDAVKEAQQVEARESSRIIQQILTEQGATVRRAEQKAVAEWAKAWSPDDLAVQVARLKDELTALNAAHAKELAAARRTAMVDVCKAVCTNCARSGRSPQSEYWTCDHVHDELTACEPIRRLIAQLGAGGAT